MIDEEGRVKNTSVDFDFAKLLQVKEGDQIVALFDKVNHAIEDKKSGGKRILRDVLRRFFQAMSQKGEAKLDEFYRLHVNHVESLGKILELRAWRGRNALVPSLASDGPRITHQQRSTASGESKAFTASDSFPEHPKEEIVLVPFFKGKQENKNKQKNKKLASLVPGNGRYLPLPPDCRALKEAESLKAKNGDGDERPRVIRDTSRASEIVGTLVKWSDRDPKGVVKKIKSYVKTETPAWTRDPQESCNGRKSDKVEVMWADLATNQVIDHGEIGPVMLPATEACESAASHGLVESPPCSKKTIVQQGIFVNVFPNYPRQALAQLLKEVKANPSRWRLLVGTNRPVEDFYPKGGVLSTDSSAEQIHEAITTGRIQTAPEDLGSQPSEDQQDDELQSHSPDEELLSQNAAAAASSKDLGKEDGETDVPKGVVGSVVGPVTSSSSIDKGVVAGEPERTPSFDAVVGPLPVDQEQGGAAATSSQKDHNSESGEEQDDDHDSKNLASDNDSVDGEDGGTTGALASSEVVEVPQQQTQVLKGKAEGVAKAEVETKTQEHSAPSVSPSPGTGVKRKRPSTPPSNISQNSNAAGSAHCAHHASTSSSGAGPTNDGAPRPHAISASPVASSPTTSRDRIPRPLSHTLRPSAPAASLQTSPEQLFPVLVATIGGAFSFFLLGAIFAFVFWRRSRMSRRPLSSKADDYAKTIEDHRGGAGSCTRISDQMKGGARTSAERRALLSKDNRDSLDKYRRSTEVDENGRRKSNYAEGSTSTRGGSGGRVSRSQLKRTRSSAGRNKSTRTSGSGERKRGSDGSSGRSHRSTSRRSSSPRSSRDSGDRSRCSPRGSRIHNQPRTSNERNYRKKKGPRDSGASRSSSHDDGREQECRDSRYSGDEDQGFLDEDEMHSDEELERIEEGDEIPSSGNNVDVYNYLQDTEEEDESRDADNDIGSSGVDEDEDFQQEQDWHSEQDKPQQHQMNPQLYRHQHNFDPVLPLQSPVPVVPDAHSLLVPAQHELIPQVGPAAGYQLNHHLQNQTMQQPHQHEQPLLRDPPQGHSSSSSLQPQAAMLHPATPSTTQGVPPSDQFSVEATRLAECQREMMEQRRAMEGLLRMVDKRMNARPRVSEQRGTPPEKVYHSL
ncbi:unnamed protein product [Amoebophrya sp. A25]|nr:unnamed protein product [Amoebophrya sp. A25]|eukprot:GSA25T00002575001.1